MAKAFWGVIFAILAIAMVFVTTVFIWSCVAKTDPVALMQSWGGAKAATEAVRVLAFRA